MKLLCPNQKLDDCSKIILSAMLSGVRKVSEVKFPQNLRAFLHSQEKAHSVSQRKLYKLYTNGSCEITQNLFSIMVSQSWSHIDCARRKKPVCRCPCDAEIAQVRGRLILYVLARVLGLIPCFDCTQLSGMKSVTQDILVYILILWTNITRILCKGSRACLGRSISETTYEYIHATVSGGNNDPLGYNYLSGLR